MYLYTFHHILIIWSCFLSSIDVAIDSTMVFIYLDYWIEETCLYDKSFASIFQSSLSVLRWYCNSERCWGLRRAQAKLCIYLQSLIGAWAEFLHLKSSPAWSQNLPVCRLYLCRVQHIIASRTPFQLDSHIAPPANETNATKSDARPGITERRNVPWYHLILLHIYFISSVPIGRSIDDRSTSTLRIRAPCLAFRILDIFFETLHSEIFEDSRRKTTCSSKVIPVIPAKLLFLEALQVRRSVTECTVL